MMMNIAFKQRSESVEKKKSQFHRLSQNKENSFSRKAGQCPEYGKPDFVCFKIGKLEFYTRATAFARHSQYFKKVHEDMFLKHQAEEMKEEADIKE